MQTINQLNEKIQILQSDFQILQSESNKTIAAKDAAITSLEQAMNERSNVTTELSVVIVIPSSDEIDHHGSKVIKIKWKSYYFTLRRNRECYIRRWLFGRNISTKIKTAEWRGAGVRPVWKLPSNRVPKHLSYMWKWGKFGCQENKSNETLDENCEKILMFTNETSSCFCRGSNRLKRNSENILRRGWSKYIR